MRNIKSCNYRKTNISLLETHSVFPTLMLFFLLAAVVAGCGKFRPTPADTVLMPEPDVSDRGSWPEFHRDGQNQGALFVPTEFAIQPKWSVEVGPVTYSSPVLGGDGTVYLGNLNGELLAVHPAGYIQWRVNFNELINSSPAIARGGWIYVVTIGKSSDNKFRSTLHILRPSGELFRSILLPDNGFTSSSPKIWYSGNDGYVFLYTRRGLDAGSLLIYSLGGSLFYQAKMGCNFPITGEDPILDKLEEGLDVLWDSFFGGGPGINFDVSGLSLLDYYGWINPTAAVIDDPDITPVDQPIIILVDNLCFIKAYRWDPPTLTELWSKRHDLRRHSSPAAFESTNLLVLGSEDGHVRALDILTGGELWKVKLPGGAVLGTPASLGGLVYVTSQHHLRALNPADGSTIYKQDLSSETVASLAMSGSNVYVSQNEELVSYSFDFRTRAHAGSGSGGGLASPAIGQDGTVYVVSRIGRTAFLRAYGGVYHKPVVREPDRVIR